MSSLKTLSQWLAFLENRHLKEIQLGLSRINMAATELELLPYPVHTEQRTRPRVITVGGTNGKGSTVALLESIYIKAGFSVAAYTSPHLLSFNERIRVNQVPISDQALCTAFDTIQKTSGFDLLSYFEVATLAALWYFKQHPLDLIILEVGLGGRLDAVNCIDCDLAIITTIEKDHEAFLGNTIEAIAFEKAGILRENTPYIYADVSMPQSILRQAESLKAEALRNGVEYHYEVQEDANTLQIHLHNAVTTLPKTSYHNNSLVAAFVATRRLDAKLPVSLEHIKQGIQSASLPGRQQYIQYKNNRILLDVAHNPQALRYLAAHLSLKHSGIRIHAIFSALRDKDLIGMFNALKTKVDHWYITTLDSKRAADASSLLKAAKVCNIAVDLCYNEPILALQAACNQAEPKDLIVVFGSFVLVSQVLKEMV